MTVMELEQKQIFKKAAGPDGEEQTISSVYCCDLLSIAMGRAPAGCAWVTVMSNINTLAVAALTEAACVILAEGTQMEPTVLKKAQEEGIPVFQTELPVFEAALKVHELLL